MWRACILSNLGRHQEAAIQTEQALKFPPSDTSLASYLPGVFFRAGLKTRAQELLRRITRPAGNPWIALAALGRPEDALGVMDAQSINPQIFSQVLINHDFDPIRHDPRFVRLLTTLGLTEAYARAQHWRAANGK